MIPVTSLWLHSVGPARCTQRPSPRSLVSTDVVCPPIPGAFSASGLVGTDLRRDYVRTVYTTTATADPSVLEVAFADGEPRAATCSSVPASTPDRRRFDRSVDARYERQSYELTVPIASSAVDAAAIGGIAEAFHARHAQTYGHDNRTEPVQFVSLRVAAIGIIPPLTIASNRRRPARVPRKRPPRLVSRYWRGRGQRVRSRTHAGGPASHGPRCNRERSSPPSWSRPAGKPAWMTTVFILMARDGSQGR